MSLATEQVLDSARYFGDQTSSRCVCCNSLFPAAETHCHVCQAPLDVSRTIAERNTSTRFVSLLGASGAGKTVYLGMLLDMLSKGGHALQGVANGPFSVAVQADTVIALENRSFPEKTASEAAGWQWVHCEVRQRRRKRDVVDLVTPDFAGEAISLEIDRPGTYPAIRSIVGQSQGLLMLCDAIRSSKSPLDEDLFAVKLAAYVYDQHKKAGRRGRHPKVRLPIAIVLTKCDGCPEVREDAHKFAKDNLTRLYQYCEHNFANFRFFAASVVGSSAVQVDEYGCRRNVPFHVEPRGIVEPLAWILSQR